MSRSKFKVRRSLKSQCAELTNLLCILTLLLLYARKHRREVNVMIGTDWRLCIVTMDMLRRLISCIISGS